MDVQSFSIENILKFWKEGLKNKIKKENWFIDGQRDIGCDIIQIYNTYKKFSMILKIT